METIKNIIKKFSYLKGVIYFVVILLAAHYLWKFSFIEGKDLRGLPQIFLWRSFDLSFIFNTAVDALASQVYYITHDVFNMDIVAFKNSIYVKEISSLIKIVWSCSGLKQMFVFFCIIAFYPGAEKHKLWFIPVGLLLIWFLNVLRISAIVGVFAHFPEQFDFVHEMSKYIFYFVIFMFWVFWEEKIRK
jgi:exosortase/archaeosortase family protein